jgi:hypothetical protein
MDSIVSVYCHVSLIALVITFCLLAAGGAALLWEMRLDRHERRAWERRLDIPKDPGDEA